MISASLNSAIPFFPSFCFFVLPREIFTKIGLDWNERWTADTKKKYWGPSLWKLFSPSVFNYAREQKNANWKLRWALVEPNRRKKGINFVFRRGPESLLRKVLRFSEKCFLIPANISRCYAFGRIFKSLWGGVKDWSVENQTLSIVHIVLTSVATVKKLSWINKLLQTFKPSESKHSRCEFSLKAIKLKVIWILSSICQEIVNFSLKIFWFLQKMEEKHSFRCVCDFNIKLSGLQSWTQCLTSIRELNFNLSLKCLKNHKTLSKHQTEWLKSLPHMLNNFSFLPKLIKLLLYFCLCFHLLVWVSSKVWSKKNNFQSHIKQSNLINQVKRNFK